MSGIAPLREYDPNLGKKTVRNSKRFKPPRDKMMRGEEAGSKNKKKT